MLAQTLDNTMAKAQKIERMTKATKFSNVFRAVVSDGDFAQSLANRKLSDYVQQAKSDVEQKTAEEIEDIQEFIDEDPDDVSVKLEFASDNGLPFFRSIQMKLNKLYPIEA